MNWHPDIADRPGPRYLAIADQLERDIRRGRLNAGHRLPTHRALARSLGVTVGTVTRAYGLAERQGLIHGTVGRGTFVNPLKVHAGDPQAVVDAAPGGAAGKRHEPVDLVARQTPSLRAPARLSTGASLSSKDSRAIAAWAADLDPVVARRRCEQACEDWLRRSGLVRPGTATIPMASARQALVVALAAIAADRDTPIACDRLTSADLRPIARMLGLRVITVASDDDGMTPEALELGFRSTKLAAVYLMPASHVPTASSMSVSRRTAIAQVAARSDGIIIEDRRGAIFDTAVAVTMAALAPDATVTIHDFSGSGRTSLDLAALSAPQRLASRLHARRAVLDAHPSAPSAMAFAEAISSGRFEQLQRVRRAEIGARVAIAREVLADFDVACRSDTAHIWLKLPEPWRLAEFVRQLAVAGVTVAGADNFVADQGPVPPAVQIGLGGPAERTVLLDALTTIAKVLSGGPEPELGLG